MSTGECSAVVLTDMPLEEAKVLNEHLRYRGIKTVFCRVYGVCGVVFADVVDSVQNLNPLGLLQPEVLFLLLAYLIVIPHIPCLYCTAGLCRGF